MKQLSLLSAVLVILIIAFGCNRKVPGSGKVELKNQTDSVSYALGYLEAQQFSRSLEQVPFDTLDTKSLGRLFSKVDLKDDYLEWRSDQFDGFNEEVFRTAYINELAYGFSYFDDITADVYLRQIFERVRLQKQAREQEEAPSAVTSELETGAEFLAENAQRPEVTVTNSGLQYEILVEGDGPRPQATDQIRCHYHGTLVDGEVFDSSVQRGEPIVFGVGQVIPGWTEALQLMPVGSKWKLYIPSHLAYGENGAGNTIGPNETLIFEVELIEIVD